MELIALFLSSSLRGYSDVYWAARSAFFHFLELIARVLYSFAVSTQVINYFRVQMLLDPDMENLYAAFTVENYVEEEFRFYKDARKLLSHAPILHSGFISLLSFFFLSFMLFILFILLLYYLLSLKKNVFLLW